MKRKKLQRLGLPEQIANSLRNEILHHAEPGQQLDSISALAKQYGVSDITLRNALMILTNEGLIDRRHGSGVYVTDHVRQRAVAIISEFDIAHPRTSHFYIRTVFALTKFFQEQGLSTRQYFGVGAPEEPAPEQFSPAFVADLTQHKLCGVVGVATAHDSRLLELCREADVPVVGHAPAYPHGVYMDHQQFLQQAIRELLDQGRRRLAYIGWAQADKFRRALEQAGGEVVEPWIRCDINPNLPGAGCEEFREIWSARADKPDGLLVADDVLFEGAAMAILQMGLRVPEALAIVTAANKGAGLPWPFPVVRMEIDPDEYARRLGDLLVRLIRRQPVAQPVETISFTRTAGPIRSEAMPVRTA